MRIETEYHEYDLTKKSKWAERLATIFGGMALVIIVILVFPLVILLAIALWLRYKLGKKVTKTFVSHPWEKFIDKEGLIIERALNHQLENFIHQDAELEEALLHEEFIAFQYKSQPEIPGLKALYFDDDLFVMPHGIIIRSTDPLRVQENNQIYYINFNKKALQFVHEIPTESILAFEKMNDQKVLIKGEMEEQGFELNINFNK
ncbi:MAG: hypothetical protein AAFO07_31360 [Bacteroidota bacterium]